VLCGDIERTGAAVVRTTHSPSAFCVQKRIRSGGRSSQQTAKPEACQPPSSHFHFITLLTIRYSGISSELRQPKISSPRGLNIQPSGFSHHSRRFPSTQVAIFELRHICCRGNAVCPAAPTAISHSSISWAPYRQPTH
jgi:hypothetical protein